MAGEGHSNPTTLPPTPEGWRVNVIEDLCEKVTSGGTPLRSNTSFYQGGTHSWFKTQELKDSILVDAEERITDKALAQTSAKLFPKDTVLMAMYGDGKTITSLGMLSKEAATNQACCAMIPNRSRCEPRFLFYALKHHRSDFLRIASGGAQRNLSGKLIRRFAINTPSLHEQRAIAHILGTLDDKIELNRRMNETLEAMARALFKSWFVDFDPVRAKAANRADLLTGRASVASRASDSARGPRLDPIGEAERRDPGLPKPLADLFPDSFEDSELGEIPKGWEVWRVSDIGNVVCGKTPSTKVPEYYGDEVPFITIPDMHGNIFATSTQKMLSFAGATSQAKKTLPPGSICVSCIATPGLVVMTTEKSQTNQQINSVVPSESGQSYFWLWSLHSLGDEIRASGSGGSVLTNLSTGRFSELRVLASTRELRRTYYLRVAPIFEKILANIKETHALATVRDSLLPKLVSGEKRMSNQNILRMEATA